MKPLALILSVIGVLLLHAASPLEEIPGTNLIYTATETDAAIAAAARPATRIVTEDGMRFTDATGCVFAISFGVGRFVVTNLFQMAPGVEFAYTNINPIAWALVDGSSQIKQMAKFMAYDAAVKRWIALGSSFEDITPESIAGFNASFQSVTNTPIDAASFTLYDRGFVGDADHAEGTFYNVAGAPVTSLVDRVVFESGTNAIISASTTYTDHATNDLHKSLALITTNDVCNIVTNEVPSDGFTEWSFSGFPDGTTNISASFENGVLEVRFNFDGVAFYGGFSGITDETSVKVPCDDYDASVSCPITATRTRLTRNALGLARLIDLPPLTNDVPSMISSAAQAATNYTDETTIAAISTNNPAFVAAVTNCPVVIAAADGTTLGEFGDYGSLGALLAALAAAITWLKTNKADASSLPYALVDVTPTAGAPFVLAACFPIVYTPEGGSAVTIAATDAGDLTIEYNEGDICYYVSYPNAPQMFSVKPDGTFEAKNSGDSLTFNGTTPTVSVTPVLGFAQTAPLTDRAINAVSLTADATLAFPAQTAGKARDFVVRLTLTETDNVVPSVTFPADVAYETEGGEWPDLTEAGTYIVRLTEVPKASESETARFFLQCSSAVADAEPPSAGGAA